jgi:transposase
MAPRRERPKIQWTNEERKILNQVANSRTEAHARVQRAKILLDYADGKSISQIARELRLSRPTVERCIDKALDLGLATALDDLPRSGRPPLISSEARAWVVELACRKPLDFGYPHEMWTIQLLADHVRQHAKEAGFPSLARAGKSLIHGILSEHSLRPWTAQYYLERRDPEFEVKKAHVLTVYKEVALQQELLKQGEQPGNVAVVSVDERPGCQVLKNTAADRLPVPDKYPGLARDHEYIRLGTISLLAGLDLRTGIIHGLARKRHRSKEFIELLEKLDAFYPQGWVIKVICDNHSAHISKETRAYLKERPGRFEFIFTPKHASWLNIIEILFSKMSRTVLRGIRANSVEEYCERIMAYWDQLNKDPVVFHWRYEVEKVDKELVAI